MAGNWLGQGERWTGGNNTYTYPVTRQTSNCRQCFNCQDQGHVAGTCPQRNKGRAISGTGASGEAEGTVGGTQSARTGSKLSETVRGAVHTVAKAMLLENTNKHCGSSRIRVPKGETSVQSLWRQLFRSSAGCHFDIFFVNFFDHPCKRSLASILETLLHNLAYRGAKIRHFEGGHRISCGSSAGVMGLGCRNSGAASGNECQ